jgi:hypothetical protein
MGGQVGLHRALQERIALPCRIAETRVGLAGTRSELPRAIEASSRPSDPTRAATVPGRRARFNPNLLHDVSGSNRRATPVAELVNKRSSGTAISSARADSRPGMVASFVLVCASNSAQPGSARHDHASITPDYQNLAWVSIVVVP